MLALLSAGALVPLLVFRAPPFFSFDDRCPSISAAVVRPERSPSFAKRQLLQHSSCIRLFALFGEESVYPRGGSRTSAIDMFAKHCWENASNLQDDF